MCALRTLVLPVVILNETKVRSGNLIQEVEMESELSCSN